MRKTRKTAAVVALYTFLMLGSVSVVRADQPVTREQISSEQTETKTDSSAQTTESEATTETTTQTTQAKPTLSDTRKHHSTQSDPEWSKTGGPNPICRVENTRFHYGESTRRMLV